MSSELRRIAAELVRAADQVQKKKKKLFVDLFFEMCCFFLIRLSGK
jgi:hypothetical protein